MIIQSDFAESHTGGFDKMAEARFLINELGMEPIDAARTLSFDESEAQELAAQLIAEEREREADTEVLLPEPTELDGSHLQQTQQ